MSNSTTTFSNDTAWKAFKYSVKFVWWSIKALFKVIGFLFIEYKEHKARKAAERAAEAAVEQERIAAASAAQASAPAAQATAPVDPVAAPAADSANVKPE